MKRTQTAAASRGRFVHLVRQVAIFTVEFALASMFMLQFGPSIMQAVSGAPALGQTTGPACQIRPQIGVDTTTTHPIRLTDFTVSVSSLTAQCQHLPALVTVVWNGNRPGTGAAFFANGLGTAPVVITDANLYGTRAAALAGHGMHLALPLAADLGTATLTVKTAGSVGALGS